MNPTRYLLAAALALGLALPAAAQGTTPTVSGLVTDAVSGDPLPGVNVAVRATQIGTITDLDGRYEINLPPGNRTLLFSFVGYRDREIVVGPEQGTLNVRLDEDVLGLDEVVVTGLATSVKRTNLANSVETISARDLAGVTTPTTLEGALQGKLTGALITANSGAPGGGFSVRLRGISTLTGRSEPLYIVDGIVLNNDALANGVNALTAASRGDAPSSQDNPVNRIADIVPEDIESVEVLKGASAAAIYGARASAGVVIITTKKGSARGGTQIRFGQTLGFSQISNPLGVRRFSESEAISAFVGAAPDPTDPETTPEDIAEYESGVAFIQQQFASSGGFIDYEDEIFGQTGLLSTTDLAVSGGNDRTQFYVSGLAKQDEGIVPGTGYEKQSLRANISHELSDRATVDVTTNYVRSVAERGISGNDNAGTSLGVALVTTPSFLDIRPNADGVYPANTLLATSNPLQTLDLLTNRETINRVLSSGRVGYRLFQDQAQTLQFVFEGGVDYYSLSSQILAPRELQFEQARAANLIGTSVRGDGSFLTTTYRGALVHGLSLTGSRLFFNTQLGLTGTSTDRERAVLLARGLVPGQQNVTQAASVSPVLQVRAVEQDQAFFVQEEVNYADRVIATVGLRGDRSNLNGDVDKFYFFPKASLAVNLAQFPFWNVSAVDQLKLRVAYGQTGNVAPFGAKFTSFVPINIGGDVGTIIGQQLGFSELEPERAAEIEGGFDVSAFDGRANLEFTVYNKRVTNQLLTRQVPPSTGFTVQTFNGGTLVNNGLELGLTLLPVNTQRFRWISRTNFWTNSAEVTDLPVPAFNAAGGGFASSLGIIRIEEGRSPTQIIGSADRDGDGAVDRDAAGNPVDYQLGDVQPDFQMSFSNDFTLFENLTLNVLAHWKKGGDVINLTYYLYDSYGTSPDFGESSYDERTSTVGAERFVEDASYFRIREVGLYYSLPRALLDRAFAGRLRELRVGVSGRNLLTITPYSGYDPEVSNFGSNPVGSGVDVAPFPASRDVLFHVNFGL